MKTIACCILCLLCLTGCKGVPKEIEAGLALRSEVLQAEECSFDADITADYGDQIQKFSMQCKADERGTVYFTVIKPDSISQITGYLSADGGKLTFDDKALHFNLLAEDLLSPVSAPWILMKTLRSGNLTSACIEDGKIHLSIDDRFEEDALQLDIWLNDEQKPERADILCDGLRILSVDVKNFVIV